MDEHASRPASRREFLTATIAGIAAIPLRIGSAPAIVRAEASRPALAEGVAAGDVTGSRAVIWSRTDRPARMIVEYATTERFEKARLVRGPTAVAESDYTARLVLENLPPNQRIFYRVRFEDLTDSRAVSHPCVGSFLTPPSARAPRNVTIAWSADTCGQGWGINRDFGGLRLYDTMARAEPDVFIHVGDTIYADQPLPSEIKLDDGRIWTNVLTEAKSKVAETLDEFRGNYKYNLMDEHMRSFNARVSQVVLWDDHELRDNWYEGRDLSQDDRYREKDIRVLAQRARRAFLEFNPVLRPSGPPERIFGFLPYGPAVEIFALDLRSFRGANSANLQATLTPASRIFGAGQLDRLKARLASTPATWKIIASDLPIGLVVRDGRASYEAFANGNGGPPLGRELELADLLRHIRDRRIRNVVWITADVHYCAAHHYDPSRAAFTDFDPFWEFVAGPLHAGTFPPNDLDPTFGPEVKFCGVPKDLRGNRPPSEGLQFFGTLAIDARTRAMTVRLHDLFGKTLYEVVLPAAE